MLDFNDKQQQLFTITYGSHDSNHAYYFDDDDDEHDDVHHDS